jgi:hypothetical protein
MTAGELVEILQLGHSKRKSEQPHRDNADIMCYNRQRDMYKYCQREGQEFQSRNAGNFGRWYDMREIGVPFENIKSGKDSVKYSRGNCSRKPFQNLVRYEKEKSENSHRAFSYAFKALGARVP